MTTRKSQSSRLRKSSSNRRPAGLLRLADNPFADEDFVDDEDVDEEAMGDENDMDYAEDEYEDYPDEEDDDDEFEDEYEEDPSEASAAYMSMAKKGRRVSGPRTKLSKQIATLAKSVDETRAMQRSIAKALTTNSRALALVLNKMDEFESDFQPYGESENQNGEEGEEFHEDDEEGTMNEPGLSMAVKSRTSKSRSSRVAKDDAASSYGEKDDDIVGNREWVPDDKDKDAELSLIQGDGGDGPGPVSKAARDAASLVVAELRKAGVLPEDTSIRKSSKSPKVSNPSQLNKGEDDTGYATVVKNGFAMQVPVLTPMLAKNSDGSPVMDHKDINKVREAIGDLPTAGIF